MDGNTGADVADFQPLNLAQLYQGADAAVAQAMQTNMLVLQSSRMKQEFDVEDKLRELARANTTTDTLGNIAFNRGAFTKGAYGVDPLKAQSFEKTQLEAQKTALEMENTQSQIDERRFKQAGDRLKLMNEASTVPYTKYKELIDKGVPEDQARQQVQPLHESAIQNLISSNMFTKDQMAKFDLKPQFDPTTAEAGMRQVLGAKDMLAQYWEEKKFGQAERFHGDSMTIQIRGQNITLRGQDLTDARAQETLAQQGLEVKENADGTFNIIDKKTGTASDVLGKDGQPVQGKSALSESQGKALGFGQRAVQAHNLVLGLQSHGEMGKFVGVKQGAGNVPLVGGVLEGTINSFMPEGVQKYEQVKRDFINAVLRPESGATITPDEFKNADKQYFPQVGDSASVIKQKDAAREKEIETLKAMAGPGAKKFPEIKRPGEAGGKITPAAGAISVSAPDGKTYTFPNKEAADKFKKAAGIS